MLTEQDIKNGLAKNENLERAVLNMQYAEGDLYRLLLRSIAEGNMFWVAVEFDDETGLYEMVIETDENGQDYYEAYTNTKAATEAYSDESLDCAVYTLDTIYKNMVHKDVDALILNTSDSNTYIDRAELQEVMLEIQRVPRE